MNIYLMLKITNLKFLYDSYLWFIVLFNLFFDSPFYDSLYNWHICDCQSWNTMCSYLFKGKFPRIMKTEMYGSYDSLYGSNFRFMIPATLSSFQLPFHDSSYPFMIRGTNQRTEIEFARLDWSTVEQ